MWLRWLQGLWLNMMSWWKRRKQWTSWLKATNCWERRRKRWRKTCSKPKLRYPCTNIPCPGYILHKYFWVSQMFWHILGWFQLQKMESDLLPLQQSNSELSEKSGMLQAEKKILEDEIKRWKARTQVREEKSSQGWNYDVNAAILVKLFAIVNCSVITTTSHSTLAFGEPAKRFWSRGVQTAAHWEGSTCQTHSAAHWGEQQA